MSYAHKRLLRLVCNKLADKVRATTTMGLYRSDPDEFNRRTLLAHKLTYTNDEHTPLISELTGTLGLVGADTRNLVKMDMHPDHLITTSEEEGWGTVYTVSLISRTEDGSSVEFVYRKIDPAEVDRLINLWVIDPAVFYLTASGRVLEENNDA